MNKSLEIVAPNNEDEQKIYDILKKILGYEEFGVTDDYLKFSANMPTILKVLQIFLYIFWEYRLYCLRMWDFFITFAPQI